MRAELQSTDRRTLVLTLDADGCLFHVKYRRAALKYIDIGKALKWHSWHPTKTIPQALVLSHNRFLLGHIDNLIKKEQYDEVVFLVGSNRQSAVMDFNSVVRNKTESAFWAVKTITDHFKKIYPKRNISFDPYLLADSYESKETGSSLKDALQLYESTENLHDINNSKRLGSSAFTLKNCKTTLVMAHVAYLKQRFGSHKIDYVIYDDKPSLFTEIAKFTKPGDLSLKSFYELFEYGQKNLIASDLLPNNFNFTLFHYYGTKVPTPSFGVQGKGDVVWTLDKELLEQLEQNNLSPVFVGKNKNSLPASGFWDPGPTYGVEEQRSPSPSPQ